MISPQSIPFFPEGVELNNQSLALVDTQLGAAHPLNQVSCALLEQVNGERTIRQITQQLSFQYGWDEEEVEGDFLQLIAQLNGFYLVNIRTPFQIGEAVKQGMVSFLYFTRTLQGVRWEVKKRFTPHKKNSVSLLIFLLKVMAQTYSPMIASLGLAGMLIALILPYTSFLAGLTLPLFFLLFFTVHEWAHIIVFEKLTKHKLPYFLATRRGAFQFVRPRIDMKGELLVSFAGPLIPSVSGVALSIVLYFTSMPIWLFLILVFIAANGLVHLISYLPFAEDGKRMKEAVQMNKLTQSQEVKS
ncbi:PqqD family protein [Jeotgalibacillus sp. S-D1]|uniref:PqqD family protein n=1 Tax=Jeotgalibacillus sp. S-D1 TaxID=2552189 RepID=UPI00105A0BAA|nr:PqqD family protein [Jeotgalibacillus sp. S-D1]TDL32808.1 PqqD family protein [Jeotgalibacillus sp. S-D1]